MVYTNPQINQSFDALSSSVGYRPVKIVYNGSGIHSITGPVPLMTFNRQNNKSDSGYLNSTTVGINLTGKIVRNGVDSGIDPPGTGIKAIFGAIENLKKIFIGNSNTDNYNGILEVKCGGTNSFDGDVIFSATGVKLTNFVCDKSSDNWVFTADYNIDLEFFEKKPSGDFFVKSYNDSWSIEPLEEYIYSNFTASPLQKSEYHNPNLKPIAPTDRAPLPPPLVGGGSVSTSPTLTIVNIPRFKITRQLSAVGISVGTGNQATNSAYIEAKKWVENRTQMSFGQSESGLVKLSSNFIPNNDEYKFLYNHLRSTNFNISAGSYEVNETWLAMPTGLKYTEDYSIETSTDDKYIKTVRVQGEIQGLSLVDLSVMSGGVSVLNSPDNTNNSRINLSGSTLYQNIESFNSPILDLNNNSSSIVNFSKNKYENAISGWLYDIKPYLYRRACLGMNSADRTVPYINPATVHPPNVPPLPRNPVYATENLLNIIPISTTEGHNPRKGTISYGYEFNNKFTFLSGVIAENVTINDTNPTDVINEAFVLGRRLGPVLQNLGARTSAKKEINIEVVVLPPSSIGGFLLTNRECPLFTGGIIYSGIDTLIKSVQPYGDRPETIFGNFGSRAGGPVNVSGQVYKLGDTQSWAPTEGRYTRNVNWVYQPCNNSINTLDH